MATNGSGFHIEQQGDSLRDTFDFQSPVLKRVASACCQERLSFSRVRTHSMPTAHRSWIEARINWPVLEMNRDREVAKPGGHLDRTQRLQMLLELLADRGRLSVTEASRTLGVSDATVRRDFAMLADQQLVSRTHGGIVATSVAYELPLRYREAAGDTKTRIASTAAEMVEPGMVVGFNGGTTTSATARQLAGRLDLRGPQIGHRVTVVTNALNIATELVLRPSVRTVILGGVALPRAYEVTGPLAALVLKELWLDMLVLGVDGLSTEGASCRDESEAGVSELMVRRAERVVVVATGEKIGKHAFAKICDLDRVDIVVTDKTADSEVVRELRSTGTDVHLV